MNEPAGRDRLLLDHMVECVDRIERYTAGGQPTFEAQTLIQDAVVRNLHTPTESSQRLSEAIELTEPGVPWRDLSGFRNVVVHGYPGLDRAAIWLVVVQDLPTLKAALARMRARAGPVSN